jgi:polyhydroxyalkanoate synthesis repressor PhaR
MRTGRYVPSVVQIRKYGNRRLYDARASRYVNLDDLAKLVREGEEVRVVDAKSGADLTRETLLQVVLEVAGGIDFLPVGLLRRIIRATGDDPAQALLRRQLATALTLLHDQFDRMEAEMARFRPAPQPAAEAPPRRPAPRKSGAAPAPADGELGALRERLEALERRLRGG